MIDVVHMLPLLDKKLMELLRSLTKDEWQRQTVAKKWKVKDVASHLLDGNIRILSMLRDGYLNEQAKVDSYQDLVDYLNGLNADWVNAFKRVSPEMLIFLHTITGPLYCDYYKSLDPFGKSSFSVDWAGEKESKNWMHIAREYTEKFLHQQQIRDAVHKPGLMTKEYFHPFMNIFAMALPHTYREITAADRTTIKLIVTGEIGGSWYLQRSDGQWKLTAAVEDVVTSTISIAPDDAWKLFSKSLRPEHVRDQVLITGDRSLGEIALTMVSVIA